MKQYYIIGLTVDDGPSGIPEEYPVKCGPFDKEKAEKVLSIMDEECWISGSKVYYDLHLEEVK